jgi:DNA polymerase-3 subunit alpha
MIFTLEDYAGNYEFALFSKDYIEFERYIAMDRLLFIQGAYQLKNRHMDQMVFKIQSISLLTEILEDRAKELKVRFDLHHLNPVLMDALQETLERFKGDKKLTIEVFDESEKLQMDFLSRKMQVRIGKPLVRELSQMEHVTFKLIC